MEKYSKFKDPMTGINPFIQPKYKKITFMTVLIAIARMPIYLAYLMGFPVLKFLISIKRKDNGIPKGIIFCNSVTPFDRDVLKAALGIGLAGYMKSKCHVVFPEGTNSNNLSILKYERSNSDWSIGLKYTNECIYLYGNRFLWLLGFLGNFNSVEIYTSEGNDISKAARLPQATLSKEDKKRFMELISNSSK